MTPPQNTPLKAVLRLMALHLRRNSGMWQLLLPCALALLLPQVLTAWGRPRLADLLAPMVTLAVGMALWCGAFVPALQQQNRPLAARLVPGQVRQLRHALLGGWFIASLLAAAAFVFGRGLGIPVALGFAALLLVLTWLMRWPWLWVVFGLLLWALQWWARPVLAAVQAATAFVDAQPWLAVAMLLLIAFVGLPPALRGGDAAHLRQHRRQAADRSRAAMPGTGRRAAPGRWMQVAQRWWSWLYLTRLAAVSQERGGAAITRAMYVFGPSGHWTSHATAAMCVAIGVAVAFGVLAVLGVPLDQIEQRKLGGAALGLMSFALYPLWQLRVAMQRSLREQALMSLLPGLPRGADFNRALAWRVLVWNLVAWSLGTACAWLLIGPADARFLLTAATFGTLPFCVHNLRDWSSRRAVRGVWAAGQGAVEVLAVASVVLGLWALMRWGGVAPALVMGACVGTAAALLAWRWQRLGRWPMAWPPARR